MPILETVKKAAGNSPCTVWRSKMKQKRKIEWLTVNGVTDVLYSSRSVSNNKNIERPFELGSCASASAALQTMNFRNGFSAESQKT